MEISIKNQSSLLMQRDRSMKYLLRGVPYLPHYNQEGVFVGPGSIEVYEVELQKAGAKVSPAYLWPREWLKNKVPKL